MKLHINTTNSLIMLITINTLNPTRNSIANTYMKPFPNLKAKSVWKFLRIFMTDVFTTSIFALNDPPAAREPRRRAPPAALRCSPRARHLAAARRPTGPPCGPLAESKLIELHYILNNHHFVYGLRANDQMGND